MLQSEVIQKKTLPARVTIPTPAPTPQVPKENRAIVILSGGMDSAVVLAYAVDLWGRENVIALTFIYGQRHHKEVFAARELAKHYGVQHINHWVDLQQIGGSALTDMDIPVPEFSKDIAIDKQKVAVTYVPMRNTIFLAIAAAYAEVHKCSYIYYGANYIDSGGYPDTTLGFVEAFNEVLRTGSRDKPVVNAPLLNLTKRAIVEWGEALFVPWEKTWSCYEGKDHPCRMCNACVQRAKGFNEASKTDPLTVL